MVKNLLGEAPATDPLADKLRALGAKGQTGALVTTLELGADLSAAAVTASKSTASKLSLVSSARVKVALASAVVSVSGVGKTRWA